MNEYRFNLVVKTTGTREAAESKILLAFSSRNPDGCEFRLTEFPGDKEAWMAGAKAGTEIAFDLITRSIEQLRGTAKEGFEI